MLYVQVVFLYCKPSEWGKQATQFAHANHLFLGIPKQSKQTEQAHYDDSHWSNRHVHDYHHVPAGDSNPCNDNMTNVPHNPNEPHEMQPTCDNSEPAVHLMQTPHSLQSLKLWQYNNDNDDDESIETASDSTEPAVHLMRTASDNTEPPVGCTSDTKCM